MPSFDGCETLVTRIMEDVLACIEQKSKKQIPVVLMERIKTAYMNGYSEALREMRLKDGQVSQ